jgi:hypothetical protein
LGLAVLSHRVPFQVSTWLCEVPDTPTATQLLELLQETPLSVPPFGWDITDQTLPFQLSIRVPPAALSSPTATQLDELVQDTPLKVL